ADAVLVAGIPAAAVARIDGGSVAKPALDAKKKPKKKKKKKKAKPKSTHVWYRAVYEGSGTYDLPAEEEAGTEHDTYQWKVPYDMIEVTNPLELRVAETHSATSGAGTGSGTWSYSDGGYCTESGSLAYDNGTQGSLGAIDAKRT